MSQVTVADPDETPAANAAQPPRLELSRVQMNVVFVTILLGLLLSALDQTIVSTALPTIVGDLGGAGHVSWVVTAYMLAETVSTVLAGKFGDLFGRKRVFQLGVAVFIVGSFFCGLANSMVLLITFRAVQGLGGVWLESLSLLVLGAGIGLIMQILTLVVQNTVAYSDLGTATSGVTFFRTLGGSFGASIMGSIYANGLQGRLASALAVAHVPPAAVTSPELVHRLPAAARVPVVSAYAAALQHVFLFAVPIALVALVFALFLPQVAMRGVGAASGVGDGFAVPEGSDNEHQLANVVGQILRRDNRSSLAGILAASGSALDVATAWGVIGVFVRQAAFGAPTREADIEARIGVPPGVLRPFYRDIVSAGYLTRADDGVLELTERGQAEADKLVAAWRAWLMGELRDWLSAHEVSPAQAAEVEAALGRITLRLVREAEAEAGRPPAAAVTAGVAEA
jgi:MFS family permease